MRRGKYRYRKHLTIVLAFLTLLVVWGVFRFVAAWLPNPNHFLPQTVAYAQSPESEPTRPPQDTPTHVDSGVKFNLSDIVWEGDTAYVALPNQRRAKLSLRKDMQNTLEQSFSEHPVPHGGAVAIEPHTGRILALVSASNDRPKVENYATRALAPSASVFKLVTAAALLEKGSVDTQARVCYSGGQSMLTDADVRGNSAADNICATLEQAIGHSINAVMARLAFQHLSKEELEHIALRFAFNREIPTEFVSDVSRAEFVDDEIERAKTAAGFWHVNLSPLHGALIAAAIENHGVMMSPTIIDEVTDNAGNVVYTVKPRPWLVSMAPANADTLSRMAENTVREGTARKQFASRKGWRQGVRVAGKTGTLSNKTPYYAFNWFIGWGDDRHDKLAVSALVVNTEKWWVKGTHVAARLMRTYFQP